LRNFLDALRDAPHLLAPLTANCHDFHSRWGAADAVPPPHGRWRGEWRSIKTGHRGPLACVIEAIDERTWRADFRAGYAAILRACYSTTLSVAQGGERWIFEGTSELGRLAGGVYEYAGEATLGAFLARYRSARDEGEFRLSRLT